METQSESLKKRLADRNKKMGRDGSVRNRTLNSMDETAVSSVNRADSANSRKTSNLKKSLTMSPLEGEEVTEVYYKSRIPDIEYARQKQLPR